MRVLYISYDGLSDNLGQSQVLPYLEGLSKEHEIHILSCDKPKRLEKEEQTLRERLSENSLQWFPIGYHKEPPVLSTVWDLVQLRRKAKALHTKYRYDLIHCRSYIASLVGLWMKRKFGVPFLFDMRGFWVEERIEGKIWDPKKFPYSLICKYFKQKEKAFISESSQMVSLTQAGKKVIESWESTASPITVIPCCADTEFFNPDRIESNRVEAYRAQLKLKETDFVLTYLGSLGTWYMLDEMLAFFERLKLRKANAKFLFVTHDQQILQRRVGNFDKDFRCIGVPRSEVPSLLALTKLGIFFCKPVFSKKASSGTKVAEMLSMGIPVIANSGIGDHDRIFANPSVGACVEAFTLSEYDRVIDQLESKSVALPSAIRSVAQDQLSLDRGTNAYLQVYRQCFSSAQA